MAALILQLVLCTWLGLWGGFMIARHERQKNAPRTPMMNGDSGVHHIDSLKKKKAKENTLV